jgi:hypothetical protein
MHNTEVVTTTDKDARDRMYQDLRQNGNELERQVIKFSSCEEYFLDDGNLKIKWRQTWSLAYPRS